MYRVLARKWRPQTFEELVGQPHVTRTLTNAIKGDRLAHAYIFAGMRGTGKTTVARLLAKCLNCEKGPTPTPCNECSPCQEIAESRAIDVLELDAASRRGIESVRELQQVVSYAPSRDRYKILILDEFHMLTKEAFNALLKTLEEPPPNVIFVLATTELQKVLPTILSRCQVFEFRRVAAPEVTAHLRKICDTEKVEISDVALERLARSGEGSVRDSLSLLERAMAFCGQTIGDEDVLRMLGAVRATVLVDLIRALAARDAGGMLQVLDGLIDEGHDLIHFWTALVGAVRDLLLQRAMPEGAGDLLSLPQDDAAALAEAAQGLSREDLTRVFGILADLEPGLKSSGQPRFLFEAALIRLASLGAVRPIEEFLQLLGSDAPRTTATPRQKKNPAEGASRKPPPVDRTLAPAEAPAHTGDVAVIVAAVHEARPMLGAMLSEASLSLSDGELCVRFPADMEPIKRQVDSREGIDLLRREAKKLAGGPVRVRVELEDGPTAGSPAPPAAPAQPVRETPPAAATSAPAAVDAGGLLEKARKEPGVRKLLDVFRAHVVDIRQSDEQEDPIDKPGRAGHPEDAP